MRTALQIPSSTMGLRSVRNAGATDPDRNALLPLTRGIGYQLRRTHLKLRRIFEAAIAPHAITPDQFVVLWVLARQDGLTQRQLCECLDSDPNTVSAMLGRMVHRGWLRRARHGEDGRANATCITPLGKQVWRRVERIAQRIRARAVSGLGPREVDTLVDLLTRVYESL